MPEAPQSNPPEFRQAFQEYEREVRVRNYQVGCLLALVFMPAGASLDFFVYHERLGEFFKLRLLCSALLGGIWVLLHLGRGLRFYKGLGLFIALLPLFFITWMIYRTSGAASPYYAGLNLVMLGAAILLRWTLYDSIVVFLLSLAAYMTACHFNGTFPGAGIYFNNLYFLFVTGVFIITGSWFYNRLREREFALQYELKLNEEKLAASYAKLKELDEAKGNFFANISHELRTPLTLLIAPLETLLRQPGRLETPAAHELLVTMQTNAMRLLKLINDLLALVKLDSKKMNVHREPVAVADFVHGLASSLRKVADDKRLTLETRVPENLGAVSTDRDKLEKILLNLLFNAVKFTPAGGRVELGATRQDSELVLQVSDTGAGISAEQQQFLFGRFWQADTSSQRKYQGAGLGLALVKELAEVQGGGVTVASEPGKGSTFTVRLPWLEPVAETGGARDDTHATEGEMGTLEPDWIQGLYRRAELFPSLTPLQDALRPVETANTHLPRVLIADDEPDMLRYLKSQLSGEFQVLEAVDGHQAVEKAAQFLPDLILCDMMMPEKDGLEVCRDLRARTPTRHIPIVLLTARADEETKLAALSAGASDFLTKPFSTTELHVRLANLAAAYRLQRQLARQNQVLESTVEQLKETETQLVQTENLASLGRLSAGIIHEINNPLNYVKMGVLSLQQRMPLLPAPEQPKYAEILGDVSEGVERVIQIVSDLRGFTQPGIGPRGDVRVAEVVESSLRFLSHEWHGRVEVKRDIPDGLAFPGRRNQIVQVLINLLKNAVDALKAQPPSENPPTIEISARREKERVWVVIRDNGPGIAPENLAKIFDPFFTTKDVGEGMGLGLSICHRIVQDHEGRIRVRSEAGRGCEFTLEFPAELA